MNKIQVNGMQVAYERRGAGMPLVLIHGYPLDHSIWKDVIPFLEPNFDMILPDLRGFGESSISEESYSMTELAGDIASMLDKLGIEKAAIAGHSMGGYVALAFAKAHPNRVNGLALVSSQAAADSPERREGRYKAAADVLEHGVQPVAAAMTDKLSRDENVRRMIRPLIGRQSIPALTGALKAMAEREDQTSFIASFTQTLVIIHGDADELIPLERGREIAALVPSAQLTVLPGAGHLPMMEMPEETASALKRLN